MEKVEKIFKNSSEIQDIADRVKILSINASIESARAGIKGKGFKVIASEISKLSEFTSSLVKNILTFINEAKQTASTTIQRFGIDDLFIQEKLKFHREEFVAFYDLMKSYYEDFNGIFSLVNSTTNEINSHIAKFNPVFQYHDIAIQQLQNLGKIIKEIIEEQKTDADMARIIESTENGIKQKILDTILLKAEKTISTVHEIRLINDFAEKYGRKKLIEINEEQSCSIEIF
jgi:methyl-accepting chemotaxis protein